MTATVNTEIGGAAIGGQGGGGAVDSVNSQTGVVVLTASDVGAAANSFTTIAVSGQSNVVADSATDTLTIAAGSNIAVTTNATTDTVTIAASGLPTASFTTVAVSGQSDVVADSAADTLTLAAGTGVTLTTNATTDTVTITNAGAINSFTTVAVSGQSDVVADSATDTLTLAAGSGITLTTNASTDTVTVTNSEATSTSTFTPTLVSSGGGTPVYSVQFGTYWLSGNIVHFSIRIVLSSTGTLASGTLTIAGLPFTVANVSNYNPVYVTNANSLAAGATTAITSGSGANSTSITVSRYSAGTATQLAVADLTNTSAFTIAGWYTK